MTDYFCSGCGIIEAMDDSAPICWVCESDEFLVMDEVWCKWVVSV